MAIDGITVQVKRLWTLMEERKQTRPLRHYIDETEYQTRLDEILYELRLVSESQSASVQQSDPKITQKISDLARQFHMSARDWEYTAFEKNNPALKPFIYDAAKARAETWELAARCVANLLSERDADPLWRCPECGASNSKSHAPGCLSANVSAVIRNDSVVTEGVTLQVGEKPAFDERAKWFRAGRRSAFDGLVAHFNESFPGRYSDPLQSPAAEPSVALSGANDHGEPVGSHEAGSDKLAVGAAKLEPCHEINARVVSGDWVRLKGVRRIYEVASVEEEPFGNINTTKVHLRGHPNGFPILCITEIRRASTDDECQRILMCSCGHTRDEHFAGHGMSKEERHPCNFDSCSCLKFDAWQQDPNVITHAVCRHGVTKGERCPDCEAMHAS